MSNSDKTEEVTFEQQVMEQFANLNRRMDSTDARLSSLETKVDERLRETRPIWEQLVSDVAEIKSDVAGLKSEVSGVKDVLELTNLKLDQVILEVADLRAQWKKTDAHIGRLEQDLHAERVK